MASSKISQLQLLQQNLQGILQQKQLLETDLIEVESSLLQVASSPEAYRIIGKVMVLVPKDILLAELDEKKQTLLLRIASFTKQENKVKDNLEVLQQEVLDEMKVTHE